MEQLQEFYNSLPEELQGKIAMLEPEEQQQVLMDLMQRYQDSQSEYAQMGANPQGNKVPVEAERNETITVQDGEEPEVEGGYLKQISRNPVSGQATYEIPDNHHNATHDQGGVSMELKEGDVVNSDKTKIPTDFKVDGSNFKGKTFKQASDYISKRENDLQKNFNDLAKKGKVDKVSEGSLSIMLAKLASSRNQLNELQEIVLGHKEKTKMRLGGSVYAETGVKVGERIPYIYDFQMPNYQYDNLSKGKQSAKLPENVKDRMVNTYHAPYPVIQAADGVNINDIHSKISPQTTLSQFMEMTKGLRPEVGMNFSGKPVNVKMPKEQILRTIVSESNKNGVDPAFMLAMGNIESGFNPNAKAGKSSATGIYQFIESTAKQYGLIGDGFDNRKDPIANTKAAIQLTKDNQKALEKYDIPVNPTTLYLAHQQGVGGAVEIYNAAMKGTPVSVAVARNMQNNFKTTDPASYLSKTAQEIMSRVNAYIPKLDNFDQKADYEAFNYKQNYSTNAPIQQIKDNISRYGMKGLIKRTKEGAPLTAYNEQSPEQEQYQKYGGFVNRPYSMTIPGSDYMGGRKDYNMDGNYESGGYITPQFYNMSIPGSDYMGKRKDYLMDGNYAYGGPVYAQDGITAQGIDLSTAVGGSPVGKFNYVQNVSKQDYPVADYNLWNEFIDSIKNDPSYDPYIKNATKVANKYGKNKGNWEYYARDKKFGNVHKELYPAYSKWVDEHTPPTLDFKINPTTWKTETYKEPFNKTQKPSLISAISLPKYNESDLDNKSIIGNDNYEVPASPGEGDLENSKEKRKGASWMDKINYGLREAIPYLDNLRLLFEKPIMPTLQQKPYQNPYDNLSTDYSIQSALNDIDRNTLTAMADERGNPSVRNARMAQVYANAIAGKAPLYTQKYNKEQELKNAKTLGQYDYLNKWTDTNMALRKRYETEVLQTLENQRQQQHMALDKMANDYLRRQEQNQALQLALMPTNYRWDKYKQEIVNDPEKAAAQMQFLKTLIQLQNQTASTTKKKSSKDDDTDTDEITIGGKKFKLNPVTETKYGGSIKDKKKLSLKNYY